MTIASIGDLAGSFVNRSAHARVNRSLATLAEELTTGLKSDRGTAAAGDRSEYVAIERILNVSGSYESTARETALKASAQQLSLQNISAQIDLTLSDLLGTGQSFGSGVDDAVIENAELAFAGTVSALSTQLGDRYLFSGTQTGTSPLRDANDILTDVKLAVAGSTDAQDVITAIDQYFAAGGPFETNDYLGGTQDIGAIEVGPQQRVVLDIRADDENFRNVLAGIAKIAVLGETTGLSGSQVADVVDDATSDLTQASTALIDSRASVGAAEARIDDALAQLLAERAMLEQARIDMIGADPYETAALLEQTQLQLEQLYTVTAKLSRLSLVNYL